MARRNRKSRKAAAASNQRNIKLTEEDKAQERSFFVWTGVITLLIVVALYFMLA